MGNRYQGLTFEVIGHYNVHFAYMLT